MYTKIQKQIVREVNIKVKALFKVTPVPAHGYDHVARVVKNAIVIAKAVKANIFLCELAAVLHDVGRTLEKKGSHAKNNSTNTHHELSYKLCREWFRKDKIFSLLTKEEKIILLYAVRYHYNNAADKYQEAIILRDADKLDALGNIGVKRAKIFFKNDYLALRSDFRFKYDMYNWLITNKARQMANDQNLMRPINEYQVKLLKKEIKPVSL
ncbi:MAG: HD domain-containing protein [Candidatus Magasanikbacteria bacterium]|nr:HD domain-containing protein [Candidatus Magasanikbacteria bacterium]